MTIMVRRKILIAEDDEDTVFVLKMALEREKFRIITAIDGKKTLHLARKEIPDLIILDVMMPCIDGYQGSKKLRKNKKTKKIPIFIITAKA